MIAERLPPYSMESEEGVTGSMLIGGNFTEIKFLKPGDFYSDQNRLIFQACFDVFKRDEAIDQITVTEELHRTGKLEEAGGAAYLSHLIANTPTSLDAPYYANIVHRLSIARQLIQSSSQIASLGYDADTDVDSVLKKAFDILDGVRKGANVNKFEVVTPAEMSTAMLDLLNKGQESLSWGFIDLDKITTGIYPQDYVIIGARPSVGKTQIMLEVAENIAMCGKKVLFVSTEMPMNPVIERHISRTLGISVRSFRERKISPDNPLDEKTEKDYVTKAGLLNDIPIYYLFGKRSSDSIFENAQKMKEKYGLDAIFVDYLQLLTDCNKGRDNHSVAVGVVSHNLKSIGQSLNVPIVVASQLNRSLESRVDKRPMLSDLRESGDIEQDADVVFLLNRPELYPDENGQVAAADKGVLELIMAKNRQLGTGESIVKLEWRPDAFRYGNKYNYL